MVAATEPKEQVLYSATFPPESRVEVKHLASGCVAVIVRGRKPKPKT